MAFGNVLVVCILVQRENSPICTAVSITSGHLRSGLKHDGNSAKNSAADLHGDGKDYLSRLF